MKWKIPFSLRENGYKFQVPLASTGELLQPDFLPMSAA
jgi:hypothetical protein